MVRKEVPGENLPSIIYLVRTLNYIYLYLDGVLQSSIYATSSYNINNCIEPIVIGVLDSYYFNGYVDELRLVTGVSVWESNFVIPSEPYTITSEAPSKSDARWLRIGLENGDGINRCIDTLGIYPNIRSPYKRLGGFNCDWSPLGNSLSNYLTRLTKINPQTA